MDYDALEESGLGATPDVASTGNWLTNLTQAVKDIAGAAAPVYAAKQIAKTGQVPTAQVNVGVSPDVRKLMIYGGMAVLGGFLLFQMMGKKRR